MAHLTLSLLGTFGASIDGEPVAGFVSDKARALLAYLVVEAGSPHHRSQLADLLWSEWPEQIGRTYLRHALANLRQLLGDRQAPVPFLLVTRDTLQFNRAKDHIVDALTLETAFAQATVQRNECTAGAAQRLWAAVMHYDGPFLQSFTLDGCAAFEQWVLLTRERFQRRALEALQWLAAYEEEAGDYMQARQAAQRQLELEPWLEEAHRQLMRLLALDGQRSVALAQYERCRRILRQELGVDPEPETQALAEKIRAHPGGFQPAGPDTRETPDVPELAYPSPASPAPIPGFPAQLTRLVGRTQELGVILRLFREEGARLVTLTGFGGVGKTRLALEVAQALVDEFADGVYFVALASIREPSQVIAAIAQTLGAQQEGGRPWIECVQRHLRATSALLVLDNFEQVAAAAPVVTDLLAACPHLYVLCTSREALHLQGEFEVVVPSLAVPSDPSTMVVNELATYAAIELFRQRAVAVHPRFVLDAENTPVVAQICMLLDGLPLAIELAAARLKLFSPQALLQRVNTAGTASSLHFLKAPTRDAPDRHRSLWDAIAWSYSLLSADEQTLFRRMAIFAGGCTLSAAASVCTEGQDTDLLDRAASLVDKSLLRSEEQAGGELRLGMVETLREFGLECLQESGELLAMHLRHAEYYTALAEEADKHMAATSQQVWLNLLDAEQANMRTALHWSAEHAIELGLRLGAALPNYWTRRGRYQEALDHLTLLLQRRQGQEPRAPIEVLLHFAGVFSLRRKNLHTAYAYFERSAEASRKLGNRACLADALGLMAGLRFEMGDYAAADALHGEWLQLAEEVKDTHGIAMGLSTYGRMLATRGQLAEGRRLCKQGLTMVGDIGDQWGIALAMRNMGLVLYLEGNLPEAQTLLEQALQLSRALEDAPSVGTNLYILGRIRVAQGDRVAGRALLLEGLSLHHQVDSTSRIADTLDALAQVAAAEHRPQRALRLIAAAAALRASTGFVLAPLLQAGVDQVLKEARLALNEEVASVALTEGEAMTLEEAIAYALSR